MLAGTMAELPALVAELLASLMAGALALPLIAAPLPLFAVRVSPSRLEDRLSGQHLVVLNAKSRHDVDGGALAGRNDGLGWNQRIQLHRLHMTVTIEDVGCF